jgi:hypothetical protein
MGSGTRSASPQTSPLALQRLAYHAQDQARVAAPISQRTSAAVKRSRTSPDQAPAHLPGQGHGIFTFEDRVYSGPWVVTLKKAVERKHLMAYLSKPVSSAIWSLIPGAGLIRRTLVRISA